VYGWRNKGAIFKELKKYDEALQYYDKAIEIDPNYANAWVNKGLVLEEMNDYDEAFKCTQQLSD